MLTPNDGAFGKVGNGAGDAQNTVVTACCEPERGKGTAQEGVGGFIQNAMCPHLGRGERGVGEGTASLAEALGGKGTGAVDTGTHGKRAFSRRSVTVHIVEGNGTELYLNVNAVKKRTRYAVKIASDLSGGAGAGLVAAAKIAAFAGVHGANQHKAGGITYSCHGAGDGNLTVL